MKFLTTILTTIFTLFNLCTHAQELKWIHGLGSGEGGSDAAFSTVADADGNVYITGSFEGTADFDPSPNIANLSSGRDWDIFLAKYDSSGNYEWGIKLGKPHDMYSEYRMTLAVDTNGNVILAGNGFFAKYDGAGSNLWTNNIAAVFRSVVTDGNGNLYVTGFFGGTTDFDPSGNTGNLTSADYGDIFFAKYDSSGSYIWAKHLEGADREEVYDYSVGLDISGNVYLTGTYRGTVDFDPSGKTVTSTPVSGDDFFLAKYDSTGNYIWVKSIGGMGSSESRSMAVDENGNAYITGRLFGTADFDPSGNTGNLTSTSNGDIFLAKYDSSGSYVWANNMEGGWLDYGESVIIDGSGNVCVAGYFRDTVDFDPSTGTAKLISNGGADVFLAKYDTAGSYIWAKGIGGTGYDYGRSLAADGNGNLYVTGAFNNTADFDPSPGNTVNHTSPIRTSVFVGKYSSADGSYINSWTTEDGQGGDDLGQSIVTDAAGNIYATGRFQGKIDFDPSPTGHIILNSAGGSDIFFAKYDASGNCMWANRIGGWDEDWGWAVTLDGNGYAYLTGKFYGNVDFDPSGNTAILSSTEDVWTMPTEDIFLAKYDTAGNYVWAKNMGCDKQTSEIGYSLAVDNNGNVAIAGFFERTADFDPTGNTANLTSAGERDIFIAKYDSSGNYLWANSLGGAEHDMATSIKFDGSGNVILTGRFQNTADFDPSSGTANLTSTGAYGLFLGKYDASGNYLWAKGIGGAHQTIGLSVTVDGKDNIILTGSFFNTVDFDPSSGGTASLTSSGYSDAFFAKYDALGSYLWAKRMGGTRYDVVRSVTLDSNNDIYLTGSYGDTADFDPSLNDTANLIGSGAFIAKYDTVGNYVWAENLGGSYSSESIAVDNSENTYLTGSYGEYDIFLAKYGKPCSETTDTLNITACDSLVSPSGRYKWYVNGTYNDTLINAGGCDSVVTVNVLVNSSNAGIDMITACDSYTWMDGNTYTSDNNSATFTLSNSNGCDSVVTLDLTINNSSTGTNVLTACDSYTWIDGNTYTSDNSTATHTLMNNVGCDSVVTLNLTINNSNTGTDVQTACDSFTWIDGNVYTTSNNTATHTLTDALGCDSVVTLDLIINNSTSATHTATACDSFTWIDGVTYTSSNNTATYTLTNAAGCDSIITLDLSIKNSTSGTDVITACDSYTWIDGNTYTSGNNTATHTLTTTGGCDSVVTLNLTIINVDTSVSRSGITLSANAANASYQWLNCSNTYAAISNETGQIFTPSSNGRYAVEVTANDCVDTSACYNINSVGLSISSMDGLHIYPNPSSAKVIIELPTGGEFTLKLFDASGKLIFSEAGAKNEYQLDLGGYAKGLYRVYLQHEDQVYSEWIGKK